MGIFSTRLSGAALRSRPEGAESVWETTSVRRSVRERVQGPAGAPLLGEMTMTMPPIQTPTTAAPGWFQDPWAMAPLRYWDGGQWTGHVHGNLISPTAAPDPSLKYLLPIGRSGWAIASGYLGLVSVLLIFAPLALGTGIYALHDIREHPERLGVGRAWFGIVMGAVFTALLLFAVLR